MTTIDQLVERSGDLKRELLDYSREPRFANQLCSALTQRFGDPIVADEDQLLLFWDEFVLQHQFKDGRTLVERFVRARGDLPRVERDMLLGWRNVVQSVFEVRTVDGPALLVDNLVDEMPYRTRSNRGVDVFDEMPPGTIAFMRLVPVTDEWLISGSVLRYPPDGELDPAPLFRMAAQLASTHTEATCRNPRHRERAREMQLEHRRRFVAHFGRDEIIVPGADLTERLEPFWAAAGSPRAPFPPYLTRAATVGVIFDADMGLGFYAEYADFASVFEHPDRLSDRRLVALVRGYLEDGSTSPAPLRRCAQAYPDNVDRVWASVLQRPSFSWRRDGDDLLRRYKANYVDVPPIHGFTIISERLAPYAKALAAEG